MEEDDSLDGLVRRVDPDRWLSSRFVADPVKRADLIALYAYDHELARAPKVASKPLIAEIRLAWWREVLDEIFGGKPVRAHPAAQALADAVRRNALPRAPLEAMIDGRIEVLGLAALDRATADLWTDDIGGGGAELASRVLDAASPADAARRAGRAWGLVMLRRTGVELEGDFMAWVSAARSDATAASREVSAAAFPAIAVAALARAEGPEGPRSALSSRLSLLRAVLRGRV